MNVRRRKSKFHVFADFMVPKRIKLKTTWAYERGGGYTLGRVLESLENQ